MKQLLRLFGLVASSTLINGTYGDVTPGPCNNFQVCQSNADTTPGETPTKSCVDASKVTTPMFVDGGWQPAKMDSLGLSNLSTACPFFTSDDLLCCNSDTAAIMVHNYQQLDGVFNTDCPVCAANLKRMWCTYACDPNKGNFLLDLGLDDDTGYRKIQVSIDSTYACTVFSSCKGTSFIAAAAVSSSIAFFNFLGYNGAPYSLSIITFKEQPDDPTKGVYLESESQQCQEPVPADGMLYGYSNIKNSTCSFCAKACPPPVVSDEIGFLDGFSWKLVGWTYLGFVLFTILFQVVSHCYVKKRKLAAAREVALANQTGSTAAATSAQSTSYQQRVGRPVNMTQSDQSSSQIDRSGNLSM